MSCSVDEVKGAFCLLKPWLMFLQQSLLILLTPHHSKVLNSRNNLNVSLFWQIIRTHFNSTCVFQMFAYALIVYEGLATSILMVSWSLVSQIS